MTILVTGGAGFIGANFVAHWLSHVGSPVINLDKLTYAGSLRNLVSVEGDARHIFVKGSINDGALVRQLLDQHKPQAILNFAAESHVDRSIDGPAPFIETNINGTFELLEAARAYWNGLSGEEKARFRFLHVSTDEVFGSLSETGPAFTEATAYAPNSPYSASKASSDHLVRSYHHTYGLPTLITNCSNNYGPMQYPEKLIPTIIGKALSGQGIPIYGNGQNIRDWLYVEDHCTAVQTILQRGQVGESYNIGGENEVRNIAVAHAVCALLDEFIPAANGLSYASLIEAVTDRPGHDFRYAMDISKIRAELGWKPAKSFESGLRRTVRWYVDNREWSRQALAGNA
jgi:dTDP-glucose 4,6-dehydratase